MKTEKVQLNSIVSKKYYIVVASYIIILGLLMILINKKSYAIEVKDNGTNAKISINCPESTTAGSIIECSLSFNPGSVTGQAFEADYAGNNGLVFEEFEPNTGVCTTANCKYSEKAIVYWELTPSITGEKLLGKIKYKVPINALDNQAFQVSIINGMLAYKNSNNENAEIDFENLTSTIRVISEVDAPSDVNTLIGISLSAGYLNEEVTTSRTNYTATVNSDKVSISVVKSDATSTISGNLNNINLNYGDNTITFKVISESGKEKLYTIIITRPNIGTTPTPDDPMPDDPQITDPIIDPSKTPEQPKDGEDNNTDKQDNNGEDISDVPNTAQNSLKAIYYIGILLIMIGSSLITTISTKKKHSK